MCFCAQKRRAFPSLSSIRGGMTRQYVWMREWIPVRPATDSALMDAMAWVIVEEGLQDQEFLDRCCIGFDKAHMPKGIDSSECYLSYIYGEKDGIPKTPEWAEAYYRNSGRHHPQPGKALCPGKTRRPSFRVTARSAMPTGNRAPGAAFCLPA